MRDVLRNTTWPERLLAMVFLIGGYVVGGWVLVAVSVVILSHLMKPIVWAGASSDAAWLRIPSLDEYLFANPSCKTPRGIKCNQCGSSSIKNWGMDRADDYQRKHVCNHCNATLYRTAN